MVCDNCGNTKAYAIKISSDKSMECNSCGTIRSIKTYDVFFDGKPEINLADDPFTGKPRVFSSKGEKAAYLKEKGLMEAGDKYHGAPISSLDVKKKDSRPEVRSILKNIMKMSPKKRHEEYLKVVKTSKKLKV